MRSQRRPGQYGILLNGILKGALGNCVSVPSRAVYSVPALLATGNAESPEPVALLGTEPGEVLRVPLNGIPVTAQERSTDPRLKEATVRLLRIYDVGRIRGQQPLIPNPIRRAIIGPCLRTHSRRTGVCLANEKRHPSDGVQLSL